MDNSIAIIEDRVEIASTMKNSTVVSNTISKRKY